MDEIQIFAGQRYSFILTANQTVANYWIRALPNVGTQGFTDGINSAILSYSGAPSSDPTTNQTTSVIPMLETSLHPLTNPGAPGKPFSGGADVNINLNITFNATELLFTVNGATFQPPTVPVLLQILSGAKTAQDLLPTGSVYTLPPNKVVELTLPGGAAGSPVRAHFVIPLKIKIMFNQQFPSIPFIYTEYVCVFSGLGMPTDERNFNKIDCL